MTRRANRKIKVQRLMPQISWSVLGDLPPRPGYVGFRMHARRDVLAVSLFHFDPLRTSVMRAAEAAHCGVSERTVGHTSKTRHLSWHFERDPIPYALETDWPVGAAGFEPLHLEIRSAELHPASMGFRRRSGAP
jgi:hypothetical protein